jgi:hypothetical protein
LRQINNALAVSRHKNRTGGLNFRQMGCFFSRNHTSTARLSSPKGAPLLCLGGWKCYNTIMVLGAFLFRITAAVA